MATLYSKKQFNIKTFDVIIEKDSPKGYRAWCPNLIGCHSQGDTIEEARENIAEAIKGYVISLRERGKLLPRFKKDKVLVERFAIPIPLSTTLITASLPLIVEETKICDFCSLYFIALSSRITKSSVS